MTQKVQSLAGWLGYWAAKTPTKACIVWEQEELSYGRINSLVLRIGHKISRLNETGTRTERIVIYSQNSPAAITVWLAAQAANLQPVTLNREHRGLVLEDILTRSKAAVIFTDDASLQDSLALKNDDRVKIFALGAGSLTDLEKLFPEKESLAPVTEVEASAIASIMFTSGTTGISKGVMIPHGMFYFGAKNLVRTWQVTSEDVFHCWVPWFHVAAQQNVFSQALSVGATVALFPGFSLRNLWRQIVQTKSTIFGGFVTVLELLYAQEETTEEKNHQLRFGIAGHLPAKIKTQFEKRFNVPMVDAYGMSEAEPVTIPEIGNKVPVGSCGKANPDFDIEIHDSFGKKLAPHTEGQIVFKPKKQNRMMLGYLDDPERTAAAWRNGWFMTGDLGYLDEEANLFFRDRESELIRVRGENVSPQEVETTLMLHPDIHEVAVIGVPAEYGEDDLVAFVVPVNKEIDAAQLQEWCSKQMAKFMIPKDFRFLKELPRTPTSKIQRKELKKLL